MSFEDYVIQAKKALNSGYLRQSLALVKHLKPDTEESAMLLADVAYKAWQARNVLKIPETININKMIDDAYAFLLRKDNLDVSYYLQLSHVYMSEGWLDKALEIIMKACTAGHILQPAIILQRYLLLKRVYPLTASAEEGIDECMSYLLSSLASEEREVNLSGLYILKGCVDLPLYIVYLHCALFLEDFLKSFVDENEVARKRREMIVNNKNIRRANRLKSAAKAIIAINHNVHDQGMDAIVTYKIARDRMRRRGILVNRKSLLKPEMPLHIRNRKLLHEAVPRMKKEKGISLLVKNREDGAKMLMSLLNESRELYEQHLGGRKVEWKGIFKGGYDDLKSAEPLNQLELNMVWFHSKDLWWKVAEELETCSYYSTPTPFLLLVEDSYLEAYRRSPLHVQSLARLVSSLRSRGISSEDLRIFVEDIAFPICPWNLLCRKLLIEIDFNVSNFIKEDLGSQPLFELNTITEVSWKDHYQLTEKIDQEVLAWKLYFNSQIQCLVVIQKFFRGYWLRKYWGKYFRACVNAARQHKMKVAIAEECFKKCRYRDLGILFDTWRENALLLNMLKTDSATRIQYNLRGYWTRNYYRKRLIAVERANFNSILCTNAYFNAKRSKILHEWHRIFLLARSDKAADTIRQWMYSNKYSRILATTMDLIIGTINIKRQYVHTRAFRSWYNLYLDRKKRRCYCDLRFFFRHAFQRMYLKRNAPYFAEMENVADNFIFEKRVIAETKAFNCWRTLFLTYQRNNAIRVLTSWGKSMVKQRRNKRKYLKNRLLREKEISGACTFELKSRKKIFFRWKYQYSVRMLQRAFRIFIARCRYIRRRVLMSSVALMYTRAANRISRKVYLRWRKFVYLHKRYVYWAARRIAKFIRLLQTRGRIRRLRKKMGLQVNLISVLCKRFLKFQFIKLHRFAEKSNQYDLLHNFVFKVCRLRVLRCAIMKWKIVNNEQRVICGLFSIIEAYELDSDGWIGCKLSVNVKSQLDLHWDRLYPFGKKALVEDFTEIRNLSGKKPASIVRANRRKFQLFIPDEKAVRKKTVPDAAKRIFPWELAVQPRKRLYNISEAENDCSIFQLFRMFSKWIILFRRHVKRRHLSAKIFGNNFWRVSVLNRAELRKVSVNKIRRLWILTLSKMRYRKLLCKYRILQEKNYVLMNKQLLKHFNNVKIVRRVRNCARIALQCFGRKILAWNRAHYLRLHRRKIRRAAAFVASSKFRKILTRACLSRWCTLMCQKKGNESSYFPSIVKSVSLCYDNNPRKLLHSKSISDFDYENQVKVEFARPKTSQDFRDSVTYSSAGKKRGKLPGVTLEFQSKAFNNAVLQLRQTGSVILDFQKANKEKFTMKEAIYFVERANTLFFPFVSSDILETLLPVFKGSKIYIDGSVSQSDGSRIINILYNYMVDRGFKSAALEVPFLVLHLRNVNGDWPSILQFCNGVRQNKFKCLKELKCDVGSMGTLGILYLLHCFRGSCEVENLDVVYPFRETTENDSTFVGFCEALQDMCDNSCLRELRFSGGIMDAKTLKAVAHCLSIGWSNLKRLELSSASKSVSSQLVCEEIIRTARKRTLQDNGLSIIVNNV